MKSYYVLALSRPQKVDGYTKLNAQLLLGIVGAILPSKSQIPKFHPRKLMCLDHELKI